MPRKRSRIAPAHRARRRPPFFYPVPLRSRRDGWSIARQCGFLAQLYVTGSVSAAARAVGMSRAAAYRLRARAEVAAHEGAGFAWAWDHVLTAPVSGIGSGHASGRSARPRADLRKVTVDVLLWRLETGLVKPVIYQRRMTAIRTKPCNEVLFALLRRGDAVALRAGDGGLHG